MEFPKLGENCDEPTCNKLDFLPVRCDACNKIFCSQHMSYQNHNCLSAHKKDVQVPICPLCGSPVPTPRNEKPDFAVSEHIDKQCQLDPRKKAHPVYVPHSVLCICNYHQAFPTCIQILSNKCSVSGCKIKEMIPVVCNQCKKNFCLQHRFPDVHDCSKKRSKSMMVPLISQQGTSSIVTAVQGSMSEDEALARALAESIEEADRIQTVGKSMTNSQHCEVS